MNTKEKAVDLRAALKKMGYSSRQVSVRTEFFSGGSSINVKVKAPEVDFKAVEDLADTYKRVHRCEITGDILSGGNCYVEVYRCHTLETREVITEVKRPEAAPSPTREIITEVKHA